MNLVISFSGGETSAFMMEWCLANLKSEYDDIIVLFANTGQENEETLEFVRRMEWRTGVDIVWLEAVVHHGERVACSHKVVNFYTADREGKVFEDVIKKYGIPNQSFPHCTRELKLNPIKSYLSSIGLEDYDTAVGIRADEIDRMSPTARKNRLIYPLVSRKPMTKPLINEYWSRQKFRLNLKGYQGNCKWCWKKSLRKHLTLINESPEIYDFPQRMEEKHGFSGNRDQEQPAVFFRSGMNTGELRELAKQPFTPASDDAQVYPEPDLFGHDLDIGSGCSESCEVDFDSIMENSND